MSEFRQNPDGFRDDDAHPDYPRGGDRDDLRSAAHSPAPRRTAAVLGVLLFCASVAMLLLTFSTLPVIGGFLYGAAGGRRVSFLSRGVSTLSVPKPVSSYLSGQGKTAILDEAFFILSKKRAELLEVEKEMKDLEKDKNAFIGMMDEKREAVGKHTSVLDAGGDDVSQRNLELEGRGRAAVTREIGRRKGLFLEQYQIKRGFFRERQEMLGLEIRDLTRFIEETGEAPPIESFPELAVFFRKEAERALLKQFHFQVGRGEYGRAIETLEKLPGIGRTAARDAVLKQKPGQPKIEDEEAALLLQTLRLVREYKEKNEFFKKGALLSDLKMAYLGENYGKALDLTERLEKSGFMLPVLAELRGALRRNLELSLELEGSRSLGGYIKNLGLKALTLEKNGEYEKALKIYQDLLLFDLPSGDREYLVKRIGSIQATEAKIDAKRRENTTASRYLSSARKSEREGREKEALDFYKKLIVECPNSDYVKESLESVIRITSVSPL
jgi:tetratricopeptide (TPR) repeat protein